MICGVIPVDKPAGFTSFDVIAKLRGILRERRLGHSGTLDPMATGVLPVFIGRATKAIDILPDGEKRYSAEFAFGYSTDTQDSTGETLEKSGKKASHQDILAALPKFIGRISQLPPMYSAVRVDGKRLYDLARAGKTIERTPREIEVYDVRLTEFDEDTQCGALEIDCSKGTYIRTIINDLGEELGTFGVMTALRRTYSQGFDIDRCLTLSQIEEAAKGGRIDDLIIPIEKCFDCFPPIKFSEKQEKMYKNGVVLNSKRVEGAAAADGLCRAYGADFLGIAKVSGGEIKVCKNFWENV